MDASFLLNLLAYCAQITVVVAAGALGAAAMRVDAAGVRYAYWRVLLALCLVLPFVQGRHGGGDTGTAAAVATFEAVVSEGPAAGGDATTTPWLPVVAAAIGVGIALRLIWLAAGLVHLRRLRRQGRVAAQGEAHEDLHRAIGAGAQIRYVAGIQQPVTFGALRPVVLLPETLRERDWHIQRAVIAHELFHVQRRDWIWTLGEELVRAVFWFHPAMWWVISRVQLSREERVDELVVLATGQRRTYLEALLAFADESPLAPAAAFARRRHLYRRMMLISKEAAMSSRRVVITCAVLTAIVGAGGWYAIGAFPLVQAQESRGVLTEPGPMERRAKPITPENPIPRRVYAAPAYYPQEAIGTGAPANVSLQITLNELGRVGEVRRVSVSAPGATEAATEAFVDAAANAVRQWIFDAPADGPIAFGVTLRFAPDAEAMLVTMGVEMAFNAAPNGPTGGSGATRGRGRSGLEETSPVTGAPGVVGGAARGVGGRAGGAFGAAPPPPPPPPPPPQSGGSLANPVRVGGAIGQPTKIRHVSPVYPTEARDAKVQGVVIIEAVIDTVGRVGQARVLRSIPLLDQAALDAVRMWEFTPTLLNGAPVPIIMTVTVNFTLL